MTTTADLSRLLDRLDGEPADALESETLDCSAWTPREGLRGDQLRHLREAVVCLANAKGGVILLGVSDRKRSRRDALTGVGDLRLGELRRAIYDGTDPRILVEIEELIEPEARLFAIRVPRGMPPHTTSEGVGKIRIGKECRPLTGSDLTRLLFAGGERDLTAEIVPGAKVSDLDPAQIKKLRSTIAEERKPEVLRLSPRELLDNLRLIQDEEVTFAALLLIGRSRALGRWVPQHEVTVLRYQRATRYEARYDLRAPLLTLLDLLRQLLESHARIELVGEIGFGELAIPEFTWWVAREAVMNALVHRDYFLKQSVLVELHPDRLVVVSPGGFVGGVTVDNILRHPPVRRNPLLAGTLQTIGLVNRAGLGVDRIYEELLRLGKRVPRYEADEGQVRLTIPTRTDEAFARFVAEEARARRKLELDDLILLRAAADRGAVDRWAGGRALQLTEEEAARRLVALRERGLLAPEGRGRGTTYRLASHLSELLQDVGVVDADFVMDEQAARLRIQAALMERGRLANSDIRRLSGYSRVGVLRLVQSLRAEGLVRLEGRGRSAHYVPGPRLRELKKRPGSHKTSQKPRK